MMGKDLIDDTTASAFDPEWPHDAAVCVKTNIADILSHSDARNEAERWSRNLRFLTFDNDDGTPSCVEDGASEHLGCPPGQCQPCEDKLPVPSGHLCAEHAGHDSSVVDREAEALEQGNPCVHVKEHTCASCAGIPLFPNHGKVNKFRIRRLYRLGSENPSPCNHFVATSYCWSSQGRKRRGDGIDTDDGPYQVVEEDGSIRPMRASKGTVDRLVTFARENGIRMIWIDQECIEQDDKDKKEVAIQAMDLVYSRAHICVGLMEAELQQKHLDTLLLVYESRLASPTMKRRGRRALNGCRKMRLDILAEAVSRIVNDKWNTRAWVLQEAFAASGRMILLFPCEGTVDVKSWLLICHELSRSEIAIRLDTLQRCLDATSIWVYSVMDRLTEIRKRKEKGAKLSKQTSDAGYKDLALQSIDEIKLTRARLRIFHPRPPEGALNFYLNTSQSRRVCNAAMALTYLKLRDLVQKSDKLAIVANLGGYTHRLNTSSIVETQTSLSLCTMVLALNNGDFSLLTPEMYSNSIRQSLSSPQLQEDEFSWAHSNTKNLQNIECMIWNPHSATAMSNTVPYGPISERGLHLFGYLWQIDEFIPLKSLQVRYADPWRRLNQLIDRGVRTRGVSASIRQSLRKATTHILYELIQDLTSIGQKSVADSILNSSSDSSWNNKSVLDLIESVDQFPEGLEVENRGGMFSLDPDPEGIRYHQCWIIDRIMSRGGIWVGRVILNEANDWERPPQKPSEPSIRPESTNQGSQCFEGTTTLQTRLPESQSHKEGGEEDEGDDKNIDIGEWSHARWLLQAKILAMMSSEAMVITPSSDVSSGDNSDGESDAESDRTFTIKRTDYHPPIRAEAMSMFALEVGSNSRVRMDKLRGKKAVFDVDLGVHEENKAGQEESVKRRLVLIPHQLELESLPRPARRACSVAWLVEDTTTGEDEESEEKGVEEGGKAKPGGRDTPRSFRTKGMVKGMWPFLSVGYEQYDLV